MSAVDGGGTLAPEAFKIRPAPRQPAPALPMPHLDGRSLLSRKAGPLRDNSRIRARLAGRYTGENVGVEQRYAAVTRALVSGIADGTWPVGSNLPGETELAEAFNVSRGTVRVALEKLQGLGLISRRKRAGTKVEARHPVVATYEPTISSVDELIQYSANSTRVIHGIRNMVADKALARRLGCAPGSSWMQVQASRSAPDVVGFPMAWWTVYVVEHDGELIRSKLKSDQRLISDLIHEANGRVLSEVRQTVRAIALPAELAPKLGVAPDTPALEFIRQYFDQARELYQVSVSIHPGERSAYSTVLKRQSPKEL